MQEFDTQLPEKLNDFVIIGLGRFGKSLALNLSNIGHQVLAVDTDQQLVHSIASSVTSAVVADSTKQDVLHSLGAQNFDCAVICIGNDIEASVLTTLICKELKIPYIIAKAQNEQHKKLLERIGADLVVFPEVFMSRKLATALDNPTVNETAALTDEFKIVELKCQENWIWKTMDEIKFQRKFKVSVLMIKRGQEVIEPEDETVLQENDYLIVAGKQNRIDAISNKINSTVDFRNAFTDAFNEE